MILNLEAALSISSQVMRDGLLRLLRIGMEISKLGIMIIPQELLHHSKLGIIIIPQEPLLHINGTTKVTMQFHHDTF
tara:strand:- start:264 stop:494 length:231 start_codon:yes stop_codon:yes gene_type:complete